MPRGYLSSRAEPFSPMGTDHQRAEEFNSHNMQVAQLRRQAHQWRLIDCSEETLQQMRHALLDEMEATESRLNETNLHFRAYIDRGQPLEAEAMRERIDRQADEWTSLNKRLQELDRAILERSLNTRLVKLLGSQERLNILDSLILFTIIVAVILTIAELMLPLSEAVSSAFLMLDTAFCVLLLGDFFVRLYLSEDRRWYWRSYWIDFFASIPFYEFLRAGRLARIGRFARLLRLTRLARAARILLWRYPGLGKLMQTFQLALLQRSMLIAGLLLIIGAISIQVAESSQLASPQQFGESLWWSFVTVVTGGFADLYNPATPVGQMMTAGLVLLGLTVTGIFTASLTSVLVEDDSTRLEQGQHLLETRLQVINQKLDLMSGETNQGLIALEEVAQQLSNAAGAEEIAKVLSQAMLKHFECMQASVHLLDPAGDKMHRIFSEGSEEAQPPLNLSVGNTFLGRVIKELLAEPDPGAIDLEPVVAPHNRVNGLTMVCPLVANHMVIGALHTVLPDEIARYYLYNRAPMTLAHHAAICLRAAQLATE